MKFAVVIAALFALASASPQWRDGFGGRFGGEGQQQQQEGLGGGFGGGFGDDQQQQQEEGFDSGFGGQQQQQQQQEGFGW